MTRELAFTFLEPFELQLLGDPLQARLLCVLWSQFVHHFTFQLGDHGAL